MSEQIEVVAVCLPGEGGKRAWKPANCGPRLDEGTFDGFPDQAEGTIDLDLREEATLDLSAGSCRRECDGERRSIVSRAQSRVRMKNEPKTTPHSIQSPHGPSTAG